MVELPKSVRVSAYDILISFATENAVEGRYGQFQFSALEIKLKDSQPQNHVLDSLLHEIGHAVYTIYGLEDEDKEERIVATLSTGWAQVWRDNPDLLRWLNETVAALNDTA